MADLFSLPAIKRLLDQEEYPAQFSVDEQVQAAPVMDQPSPETQGQSMPSAAPAQNPYEIYKPNPVVNGILQALQFSPQLGNVAGSMLSRSDQRVAQSRDLAQRYAESQQRQANEDREFGLRAKQGAREETKFGQEQGKGKSEADVRASMDDMNSPVTQSYRELFIQMFPGDPKRASAIASQMNATMIAGALPSISQTYNSKNSRMEAQARLQDADLSRAQQKETTDRSFMAQQDEKQAKKNEMVTDVEERKNSIIYNIDKAIKMIDTSGTYEAVGPHNQNLDRLVDEIATDMAKLQDPKSVARPSEVDLVKKNLIQAGFTNSNETAKKILESFKTDVEARTKRAYQVRGLAEPSGSLKGVTKSVTEMTDDEVLEQARAREWLK